MVDKPVPETVNSEVECVLCIFPITRHCANSNSSLYSTTADIFDERVHFSRTIWLGGLVKRSKLVGQKIRFVISSKPILQTLFIPGLFSGCETGNWL